MIRIPSSLISRHSPCSLSEKVITVRVTPKTIKNMSAVLSATSFTYNGKAQKPSVKLKDGSTVLKLGIDYTVSYSANTGIGTAKAIIKGNPA